MKNILFVLFCCVALVGCKKKGCTDPNASNYDPSAEKDDGSCIYNNVLSSNNEYMFSISIDGITHKVQGSFSNSISGSNIPTPNYNHCYYTNVSTPQVFAGLIDKTATSYVSGELFRVVFFFNNIGNGNTDCSIAIYNSNFILPQNIDVNFSFTDTQGYLPSANASTGSGITLNISDLGTPTVVNPADPNNYYSFGNQVRGSFVGTLYGTDGTSSLNPSTGGLDVFYDIPVQVEIEFIAPRTN